MVDPISVAAITLAIVDDLIRIGERAAELITDAKAFKAESSRLHNQLKDESSRTRFLKALLFSKASIYRGQTLFQQFDVDVQTQIELLLGQGKSILQEGCDILERRYGARQSHTIPQSQPSSSHATNSVLTSPTRSLNISVWPALRWSFRDKERVETILESYQTQNNRIHSRIKLWCLASDLGVNVDHLRRLRDDDNSKQLGFATDAALKLAQDETTSLLDLQLSESHWLSIPCPTPADLSTSIVTLAYCRDEVVLQETFLLSQGHSIAALAAAGFVQASDALDPRTKGRVNSLANLLHQLKEPVLRIPRCIGWTYRPESSTVSMYFEAGSVAFAKSSLGGLPEQTTLRSLFEKPDLKPALDYKLRLATSLTTAIAHLHMVQWLHESFRSENIILATSHEYKASTDLWEHLEPWIFGFVFSRQENDFSDGMMDLVPVRDVYRHPDRQGRPKARFNKLHDIYALGVVLLEIGLWEPALKLQKDGFDRARNPEAIKAQLVKHAERRLDAKVGKKYKEIVLKCLSGDFEVKDDTKEDLYLQQAFRTQVVDVLERAADSI